jgi:hypothetical protein
VPTDETRPDIFRPDLPRRLFPYLLVPLIGLAASMTLVAAYLPRNQPVPVVLGVLAGLGGGVFLVRGWRVAVVLRDDVVVVRNWAVTRRLRIDWTCAVAYQELRHRQNEVQHALALWVRPWFPPGRPRSW